MPIDARIPLGVQPMQPFDLTRGAMQGAQLKRIVAISEQEQREADRLAKAEATREQVKAVLGKYQGDIGSALPEIYAIDPDTGMKIQKTWNDSRESDFNLKTAKLGHDKIVAQEVGRKAQGVIDQESYGYLLANLKASGLPTEGMPPTFDPAYVESLKTKSLTVLENATLEEKRLTAEYTRWRGEQDLKDKTADNARADKQLERMEAATESTIEHQRRMEGRDTARLGLERQRVGLEGQRVKIAQADAGKPKSVTPTAEAAIINRLQTQWTKATASQNAINRQVTIMEQGLAAGRRGELPQANEAVLQTFLKILDPDSVVREGEFQRLREGASMLTRAEAAIQRLTKGGFLPMSELENYAKLAKAIQSETKGVVEPIRSRVGKTADRYNIPRDLVMDEGSSAPVTKPAAPAEGTERMINGKRAVWKTIGGQSGWVAK